MALDRVLREVCNVFDEIHKVSDVSSMTLDTLLNGAFREVAQQLEKSSKAQDVSGSTSIKASDVYAQKASNN